MNKIINKLIEFQTKITPKTDKLAHFFWGFFYSLIGFTIDYFLNTNIFTILIPYILAAYKEYNDFYNKQGKAEWLDFVFTIAPSVFILIIKIL